MNPISDNSTLTETLVQNSTTAILSSIFYKAMADSIIWLLAAAVAIICDLFFGCSAALYRGERVRISRALRRTINKMCEYICWVMLAITFSIGFDASWIKYTIFGIIYGNELSSCLSNYFEAKGKRISFDLFPLLGRRLGIKEIESIAVSNEKQHRETDKHI